MRCEFEYLLACAQVIENHRPRVINSARDDTLLVNALKTVILWFVRHRLPGMLAPTASIQTSRVTVTPVHGMGLQSLIRRTQCAGLELNT
jgi:hypothetical protein